jgi:hypothetical protein
MEKREGVVHLVERLEPALVDLFGLPQRLEHLVRRVEMLAQPPELIDHAAPLRFGGVRGQHGLDLERVDARLHALGRDARIRELPEHLAQGLPGLLGRVELAEPRALLTDVHELKE